MKASYLAAIAVAIIAIAAVGAYVLLSNGDNGGGSSEEPIRTDLKVGDYIERTVSGSSESKTTETNFDTDLFLNTYLYSDYAGDITGQETLKFKGSDVVCDVYKQDFGEFASSSWVAKDSGVVLKSISKISNLVTTTVLEDTNLDITKAKADQVLADGSFVKQSIDTGDIGMINTVTATVSDLAEGTCTLTKDSVLKIDATEKETIEAIDGTQITLDDGTTVTADDFLAGVSYKSYIKSLEDDKTPYTLGKKTSETIDTEFGKKKVTAQEITVTDEEGTETYTLYYTSNDVVYRMVQDPTVVSDIKSTSLVKL